MKLPLEHIRTDILNALEWLEKPYTETRVDIARGRLHIALATIKRVSRMDEAEKKEAA